MEDLPCNFDLVMVAIAVTVRKYDLAALFDLFAIGYQSWSFFAVVQLNEEVGICGPCFLWNKKPIRTELIVATCAHLFGPLHPLEFSGRNLTTLGQECVLFLFVVHAFDLYALLVEDENDL